MACEHGITGPCSVCEVVRLEMDLRSERAQFETVTRTVRALESRLAEATVLLSGCAEAMGFDDTEHGERVLQWLSLASAPVCEHCSKPATCFGSYEGSEPAFACDECCGHGCEDGKCSPVSAPAPAAEPGNSDTDLVDGLSESLTDTAKRMNAAEATLAAVRGLTRWEPCVVDANDEDGPVFQGFLTDDEGTWVRWEDIRDILRAPAPGAKEGE